VILTWIIIYDYNKFANSISSINLKNNKDFSDKEEGELFYQPRAPNVLNPGCCSCSKNLYFAKSVGAYRYNTIIRFRAVHERFRFRYARKLFKCGQLTRRETSTHTRVLIRSVFELIRYYYIFFFFNSDRYSPEWRYARAKSYDIRTRTRVCTSCSVISLRK